MKYYVHGSQDSLDRDVVYVFDKPVSFQEAKEFCDADMKTENRNVICIEDGIVSWCYKGTIDELNNGIYHTYHLHEQEYELDILKTVERIVALKHVRCLRGFLSHCSRTEYRSTIKKALRSNDWDYKLTMLQDIDFKSIKDYIKNPKAEVYKFFVFQLAQILGLYKGIEIYTKSDAVKLFPNLKPYLYREEANLDELIKTMNQFIEISERIEAYFECQMVYDKKTDLDLMKEIEFTIFTDSNVKINLRTEETIILKNT